MLEVIGTRGKREVRLRLLKSAEENHHIGRESSGTTAYQQRELLQLPENQSRSDDVITPLKRSFRKTGSLGLRLFLVQQDCFRGAGATSEQNYAKLSSK